MNTRTTLYEEIEAGIFGIALTYCKSSNLAMNIAETEATKILEFIRSSSKRVWDSPMTVNFERVIRIHIPFVLGKYTAENYFEDNLSVDTLKGMSITMSDIVLIQIRRYASSLR